MGSTSRKIRVPAHQLFVLLLSSKNKWTGRVEVPKDFCKLRGVPHPVAMMCKDQRRVATLFVKLFLLVDMTEKMTGRPAMAAQIRTQVTIQHLLSLFHSLYLFQYSSSHNHSVASMNPFLSLSEKERNPLYLFVPN
jgi:hypothetical protein